jgi:hypothetical protein
LWFTARSSTTTVPPGTAAVPRPKPVIERKVVSVVFTVGLKSARVALGEFG